MKKLLFLTVMVLSLLACGKPKTDNTANTENKKSVKTGVIKKEALSAQILINGNFEPTNEAAQTAPAAEVSGVYHKNGDRVKEGELIVQLYDKDIEASYRKAKAEFESAQSALNKSKLFSKDEELNDLESYKATMIKAKETLDKAKRGSKQDSLDIYKSDVTKSKKSL